MDNRETLTPSNGDAIIKRHLSSEVAQKKLERKVGVTRAGVFRGPTK
jgi:Trp operon repressor